jgi:tellurite resistance protein
MMTPMSTGGTPPAAPPIAATAWLDFDRPVEAVRAVFFDVDLAVRGKIHRGMRLQWIGKTPDGKRGVRQQMRVMDKLVVEDVLVDEGPGGVWVKRYLEGPNAGTQFIARFDPQGQGGTRVTMEAHVGKQGFAMGLGKLSALGLEKAMKRAMNEYKLALEGYEPGRARGAVLAAVKEAQQGSLAMRSLDDAKRRQLASALLETACSIACVDEGPDEAERDALRAIVAALWGVPLDAATEDKMVRAAAGLVAKEGAQARCDALGKRLRALGFGRLGVAIAALVAEVSHGLDPSELSALRQLASAAGVDDVMLGDIVKSIDVTLSGGEPASRMSQFV